MFCFGINRRIYNEQPAINQMTHIQEFYLKHYIIRSLFKSSQCQTILIFCLIRYPRTPWPTKMTAKNNYVNDKHKIWAYGSAKYYLCFSTCFWFRLGPVKNFVIKNSLKWVRFIWIYSKIVNMIIWKKCTGTFFSIFSHAVDYADDL